MRKRNGFGAYMLLMPVTMLAFLGLIVVGLYRLIDSANSSDSKEDR